MKSCFLYKWHIDDNEEDITSIRVYGIDQQNNNVCLRIEDFTPYVYIELPSHTVSFSGERDQEVVWTEGNTQFLCNKIDDILGDKTPIRKQLVYKRKMYGSYIDKKGKYKKFPFLLCVLSVKSDIKQLIYKVRNPINVACVGSVRLKIHEQNADPILQLVCCRDIPSCGWVYHKGKEVTGDEKLTLCDYEYKVSYKTLSKNESLSKPAIPKIMGFDIEVNSTNPTSMPDFEKKGDKIFQIGCVISRHGDKQSKYRKILLSLGKVDKKVVGKDIEVISFTTEALLLEGFTALVRKENINVLVGYNILGFDINYMIGRARETFADFTVMGFHKYANARQKTIKWSSSAYKNQEFEFLDAEGRLFVDLLPLVQRTYKLNNYKLKTVSTKFLGETKDPLTPQGIFRCYRLGMKGGKVGEKALGICGKYCVQDSNLCNLLMEKLHTWVDITEMSKICNVEPFTLYTQGQQIKVFSQVYKYCMYQDIVVEKDGYVVKDDEFYQGALVFDPIVGYHRYVLPFDFASLYPTTIIAYNIDYTTWVTDPRVPDELCHVFEWDDHLGCEHDPKVIRKKELTKYIEDEKVRIKALRDLKNKTKDPVEKVRKVAEIERLEKELKPYKEEKAELSKSKPKHIMCAHRKYRFRKEPMGVIPTIIQNLLAARKRTRKGGDGSIKSNKEEIEKLEAQLEKASGSEASELKEKIQNLIDTNTVLDKRQLAYKVSANSMYGAMGVRRGFMPFMPGAMCVTYMGRTNIEVVAKTIPEKYGGKLVYGDTDSNYIIFPDISTAQENWDKAEYVAAEVTKLFPKPIELEFEEEIYADFFILTKKRYMYRKCLRDGKVDSKIGKKGVLLARRDSSLFVKNIYEEVTDMIMDRKSYNEISIYIIDRLNQMCSGCIAVDDFTMTKSVGSSGELMHTNVLNEKGKEIWKVGDYTIPKLSSDKAEREEQMEKKGASTIKEYCLLCLPAQVQLAEKMKRRGIRVDAGSRLGYVITTNGGHTAKQYMKIEDVDYFKKHKRTLRIDYMYYLKNLSEPLDQLLNAEFKGKENYKENPTLEQYKFRYKIREKCLDELMSLFNTELKFEE